ncbi:kinase-like protein [Lentithecium fluviatile CBS 122367]|uniref:Kinase-like protein n=1 Tax=Lentithecium fluviatile CBS 122367 TaxID=1168545 RepID=A0A6G1J0C0_9PLEO|nr:kinase-like protein [Lentithecium fluviatile CBS 122367]
MPLFSGIQSLRLRNLSASPSADLVLMTSDPYAGGNGFMDAFRHKPAPHSSHPDFANLTLLVFEAVMEVVCVSLPGYIVARMGMFDANAQKFVANLNTQLFTPCLIFTKLASQLSADKLVELGVIPFIFVVQLIVSYLTALIISRMFRFRKRAKNFVVAMAVFGNSNSLPISLVISLSKTLSGLHWDKVPGDNDNEVAARGILYLLIFQQLGQLVRWTWGFNVLLAPASAYKDEDDGRDSIMENGEYSDGEAERLLDDSHSDYESGNATGYTSYATSISSGSTSDSDTLMQRENAQSASTFVTPTNGTTMAKGPGNMNGNGRLPNGSVNGSAMPPKMDDPPKGFKWWPQRAKRNINRSAKSASNAFSRLGRRVYVALPTWLQRTLLKLGHYTGAFLAGCWEFMNPPLWAMLAAIIVASIPPVQHAFFDPGTFLSNSVTRAVSQSGGVAVPLILVVLGANLARNTLPKEDLTSLEDAKIEKKLVIASLVSRMLIPTIIMAPLLAITAKFVPVSILDDPIFVIVCFLLTGAPSALQLAQICQINNVYMGAMSSLLFQSYVHRFSGSSINMASANGQPSEPDIASQSLGPSSNTAEGSTSPRPNNTKVVSIADPEIESISPLMTGKHKELEKGDYFDLDKATRQYRASVSGKRLSGRPSTERLASSAKGQGQSQDANPSLSSLISESSDPSISHHRRENLVKQVTAWLKNEKARRAARKAKRKARSGKDSVFSTDTTDITPHVESAHNSSIERRSSESSEGSVALEQLANILERTMSLKSVKSTEGSPRHHRRHSHGRKLSAIMKRHSTVSSGEDYFDSIDQLVPSCDAILDNSKTMAYGAGGPDSESTADTEGKSAERRARKEKEAWHTFKYEIVRLSHTLKLKGWRRVPLEKSGEISVERLSGALTNAVYVVSPPKHLPPPEAREDGTPTPKNPPPKLLLRIYGPQVEHLIDRDAELQILRRLARKRIGPRMLGTFKNGRFEEFFNARALTPQELRNAETSKQIAKRMRELHEGIDLLQSEREAGPFVWQNWDKWIDRVDQVVTWLDKQIIEGRQGPVLSAADRWKDRGLICGVEWPVFRQMVEKYRAWLDEQYGGKAKVNERLVFAHNDTQYGNILRMTPSGESPLMLPANEHKQLVVIDFEYANANLPGLEFANHFTEWTYNYHDPEFPYKCNTNYYPTLEEQHRFIRAYLTHNPAFKAPGGAASNPPTPHLGPLHTSGSSTALAACAAPTTISAFMLDSRAPPGEKYSYQEQEAQAERKIEVEARRLMAETRLWRLANSVQWVAWGIVQAHVPGLPDADDDDDKKKAETAEKAAEPESASKEMRNEAAVEAEEDKNDVSEKDGEEGGADPEGGVADNGESQAEEEEFDYLGYAQERAMFVWGDAIRLGIIKVEDLPEDVRKRVKIVEY